EHVDQRDSRAHALQVERGPSAERAGAYHHDIRARAPCAKEAGCAGAPRENGTRADARDLQKVAAVQRPHGCGCLTPVSAAGRMRISRIADESEGSESAPG